MTENKETGKRRQVYLSDYHANLAEEIGNKHADEMRQGNGKRSLGIRIALEAYNQSDEKDENDIS